MNEKPLTFFRMTLAALSVILISLAGLVLSIAYLLKTVTSEPTSMVFAIFLIVVFAGLVVYAISAVKHVANKRYASVSTVVGDLAASESTISLFNALKSGFQAYGAHQNASKQQAQAQTAWGKALQPPQMIDVTPKPLARISDKFTIRNSLPKDK